MHFLIHCLDQARGPEIRKKEFEAHQAYLKNAANYPAGIVVSGPLVQDDGVTPKGSLYLIEAASRQAAETFIHGDPYFKAGVWDRIVIDGFVKKTDNR